MDPKRRYILSTRGMWTSSDIHEVEAIKVMGAPPGKFSCFILETVNKETPWARYLVHIYPDEKHLVDAFARGKEVANALQYKLTQQPVPSPEVVEGDIESDSPFANQGGYVKSVLTHSMGQRPWFLGLETDPVGSSGGLVSLLTA